MEHRERKREWRGERILLDLRDIFFRNYNDSNVLGKYRRNNEEFMYKHIIMATDSNRSSIVQTRVRRQIEKSERK